MHKNYKNTEKQEREIMGLAHTTAIHGAALLLCSDAGRYITGADLLLDGGMHL
jgi:NAD(P)-dependent dehydrogenase (short-subunit alcohol dehydrogenase family)